jgi:ATP/ADP translocase
MSTSSNSGGIGFTGLLTIVFVTLKLIGKIDWSWWWVLSPILITVGLVLFFCLLWLIGIAMEKS